MTNILSVPAFAFSQIQNYLSKTDILSVSKSCRHINGHGWITALSFNGSLSPSLPEFIRLCQQHRRTIEKIKFSNLREPWLWLPFWVQKIECVDCRQSIIHEIENNTGAVHERKVKIKEFDGEKLIRECVFIEVPKLSSLIS